MSDPTSDLSRRGFLAGAPAAIGTAAPTVPVLAPRRAGSGIVILIDSNDPHVMGHAISYSANLSKHFASKRQRLPIEVVANGSGIDVFRADKSQFKEPLAAVRQMYPNIAFSMCASSKAIAEAKENMTIQLIEGAQLVPFGIGRVAELQMKGWAYIHG
ncbi:MULTISPECIES: DsrE family protein [unclassified Bradyrhizobium]|uniref:DsrE family protein n=1 Tax=unclassified Bradyrhizobium TaxID=2631580 RepID=UPI0029171446|nr:MULTISPECIES: DsrE family protein [unclassified Bradyrhizobium]